MLSKTFSSLEILPEKRRELLVRGSSRRVMATLRPRYPTLMEITQLPSSRDFAQFSLSNNDYFAAIARTDDFFAEGSIPEMETSESSSVDSDYEEYRESKRDVIEVCPGIFKRLRGSQETQEAWDRGDCIQATCFSCDVQLACVPDCDCVACPKCRSISPMESLRPRNIGIAGAVSHQGGVGLGIFLGYHR